MRVMDSVLDVPQPYVVVVSGPPGAGKTTLGWELSRRLHVPFLSRDDVKTSLHVTHRSNDPDEVWRFAGLAFDIFYETIIRLADAGVSLVAEAAFHAGYAEEPISRLATHCRVIHVLLTTDGQVALDRYTKRARAGERHPAHNDEQFASDMASGAKEVGVYRVSLPHPTLEVDGADGWQPSIDEIVSFVNKSR
ncbi:MAG: putative kinase [Candidatus Azotimanducaceae bacterium]|jgi:predicted kinase